MRLIMVTPWSRLVKKARVAGHDVVAVWNKEARSATYLPHVFNDAAEGFVFDISNATRTQRVLTQIIRNERIDSILHVGREDTMLTTYQIAESLNRAPNPVASIQLLNDKYLLRNLLHQRDVSVVRFRLAESISQVSQLGRTFGFPFVVKPTQLSGSRGVFLCSEPGDVARWQESITQYDYRGPFLLEEYLPGPEVSVETLSIEGRHYVIGITDKLKTAPPFFVEIGHVHPSALSAVVKRQIESLVCDLLTAVGFRFGPAHTEIIVTPSGPKIVESQARFGGDHIPRLVELATGVDIEEWMFRMLNGATLPAIVPKRVAKIEYFHFESRPVHHIEWDHSIMSQDGLQDFEMSLKPSQPIPALRSSRDRYGFAIVVGANHDNARQRMANVMSYVHLQ